MTNEKFEELRLSRTWAAEDVHMALAFSLGDVEVFFGAVAKQDKVIFRTVERPPVFISRRADSLALLY